MDSIYKALSDKNRRKILSLLRTKDMTVSELLEFFPITQASLSHHLDALKRANLVIDVREGQFIRYSLNVSVFEEFVSTMFELLGKDVDTPPTTK